MLTESDLFDGLSIEKLYQLAVDLDTYGLLSPLIKLQNYVELKYGTLSSDYMKNKVQRNTESKKFKAGTLKAPYLTYVDEEVLSIISVMRITDYLTIKEFYKSKVTVLAAQTMSLNLIGDKFLSLNKGVLA